jgi:hypothetical protein
MAHRLVFDVNNRNVKVFESSTFQTGHVWQWQSLSQSHVVLKKGVRQRTYSIREWCNDGNTECRATLTDVQEIGANNENR